MIIKINNFLNIIFSNNYLKMLLISIVNSIVIVFTLFGSYGIIKNYEIPYPSISIFFLILSILFIFLFEFFKQKINHLLYALFFSFFLSILITSIITSIIESFKMLIYGTFWKIGITFDLTILYISISMICSIIIYVLLQYFLTSNKYR